jgi:hypothetical protein
MYILLGHTWKHAGPKSPVQANRLGLTCPWSRELFQRQSLVSLSNENSEMGPSVLVSEEQHLRYQESVLTKSVILDSLNSATLYITCSVVGQRERWLCVEGSLGLSWFPILPTVFFVSQSVIIVKGFSNPHTTQQNLSPRRLVVMKC